MTVVSDFECGNIIVEAETPIDVSLFIRPDTNAQYYQWFYFKDVDLPQGITRTYRIFNASGASYHQAWVGYDVLASHDNLNWFRIPTRYDGSHLIWQYQAAEHNSISFAFFIPYVEAQREALLKEAAAVAHVSRRSIGKSLEGRELDLLVFGDESRKDAKVIWVVSRQHAGEPMAEYGTEGFIRRLLDTRDSATQQILDKATIYVVPNINPDGSAAGNLRANAAGVDLNRVWHDTPDTAPEIRAVNEAMAKTGCDYFIDMHGDEIRPYIWLITPAVEMKPEETALHEKFVDFLAKKHPELKPPPEEILTGTAPAPGLSINFIFRKYGCPGWVVELPFRETFMGDTLHVEGCMNFGRSCVEALLDVM
jgi:murein tripeptide amidase MpaA